jgi:hypothetical protein
MIYGLISYRERWSLINLRYYHSFDDMKDRFYEEIEQVFDKFPRYHIQILLGDFNAKVGREDIFKPTIGNDFT